jgi:isopentenyl-diphosphate Delta-isomerase
MSDGHLTHVESFSCYVFTGDGRLLLTMRGHAKKTWPGVWANSCYGHPATGESLPVAVSRTLRHELGLTAKADLILPASRHGMREDGELTGELCPVYRVVTDEAPTPDPAEVGDFEWVGWAEFVYAVAAGDVTVSPWCRPQVAELNALGDDPAGWPVAEADFSTAA